MRHSCFDLVLLGVHGTGKSTLGRLLSDELGVPFDEELGRKMRTEAIARDASQDAAAPQAGFDERLWCSEEQRDVLARELLPHAGIGVRRIVETWHIGNASYASARAPELASRWETRLHDVLHRHDVAVVVQPLAIPIETFHERFSEPGQRVEALRRFLLDVGESAYQSASRLPVTMLPIQWTHELTPEQCAREIIKRLGELS